jgi:hypothetical protein
LVGARFVVLPHRRCPSRPPPLPACGTNK